MNISPHPHISVEIEAKFLGGKVENAQILDWLEREEGFNCERKPTTHRLHIYYDDKAKLMDAGCRFRCVIAAGEWCRYDFKADDPSGRGETLEVSVKKFEPVAIISIIDELVERIPEGFFREKLKSVRDSARITVAMLGKHEKAIARRGDSTLELSWDMLTPLESGNPLSEVEVELLSGEPEFFDALILRMQQSLRLTPIRMAKLARILQETRGH